MIFSSNFLFLLDTYSLVLEYADSGTLNAYLSEHFNKLDWNDKYQLALQLTNAVKCMHNCNIVHRDLVRIHNQYIVVYFINYLIN